MEGLGGATAHLATLYLQSTVTPVGAAEKRRRQHRCHTFFLFFSPSFFRLFSFSNLRVKMAANENGHANSLPRLNYSQRFKENMEQILKEWRV